MFKYLESLSRRPTLSSIQIHNVFLQHTRIYQRRIVVNRIFDTCFWYVYNIILEIFSIRLILMAHNTKHCNIRIFKQLNFCGLQIIMDYCRGVQMLLYMLLIEGVTTNKTKKNEASTIFSFFTSNKKTSSIQDGGVCPKGTFGDFWI